MTGLSDTTVSPSSSMTRRSTPWVDGCCGPMLMVRVLNSGAVVAIRALRLGAGARSGSDRLVALDRTAVDLLLQFHDPVDQGLRARRAARNVHVHRHDRVDSLND